MQFLAEEHSFNLDKTFDTPNVFQPPNSKIQTYIQWTTEQDARDMTSTEYSADL